MNFMVNGLGTGTFYDWPFIRITNVSILLAWQNHLTLMLEYIVQSCNLKFFVI